MTEPVETTTWQRQPNRGWIVLVIVAGLLGAATPVAVAIALVSTRWRDALLAVLQLPTWYWLAMGAWRRTPWGLATPDNAPPGPPALSQRWATRYVALCAACAVAAALALAIQFAQARW